MNETAEFSRRTRQCISDLFLRTMSDTRNTFSAGGRYDRFYFYSLWSFGKHLRYDWRYYFNCVDCTSGGL